MDKKSLLDKLFQYAGKPANTHQDYVSWANVEAIILAEKEIVPAQLEQNELLTFCKLLDAAKRLIEPMDELANDLGSSSQLDRVYAQYEFDELREAIEACENLKRGTEVNG